MLYESVVQILDHHKMRVEPFKVCFNRVASTGSIIIIKCCIESIITSSGSKIYIRAPYRISCGQHD